MFNPHLPSQTTDQIKFPGMCLECRPLIITARHSGGRFRRSGRRLPAQRILVKGQQVLRHRILHLLNLDLGVAQRILAVVVVAAAAAGGVTRGIGAGQENERVLRSPEEDQQNESQAECDVGACFGQVRVDRHLEHSLVQCFQHRPRRVLRHGQDDTLEEPVDRFRGHFGLLAEIRRPATLEVLCQDRSGLGRDFEAPQKQVFVPKQAQTRLENAVFLDALSVILADPNENVGLKVFFIGGEICHGPVDPALFIPKHMLKDCINLMFQNLDRSHILSILEKHIDWWAPYLMLSVDLVPVGIFLDAVGILNLRG